jgi:hypothetical protein
MMTLSITLARDLGNDLPLFKFNFRTERTLEDALDDWLSSDRIDEAHHAYSWTDESDGDGQVETATVVAVLRDAGYQVEWHPWGLHNTVIDSINKNGVELIPESAEVGYDDPRKYLPKSIIRLLDEKLAPEAEVAA